LLVDTGVGRREENKQRTRSALEEAAARLFDERGFGATTVRDIAAAAGVGERTFFRYFPSKEDLVLGQVRDLIPGLMDRVRDRPAHEAPRVALREAILDWLAETGTLPTILVSGPPKSSERHAEEAHALLDDLENAVTDAFLDRLAEAGADRANPSTRLRAAVQARAGVSALRGMMIVFPGGTGDSATAGCGPVPDDISEPIRARSTEEVSDLVRQAFAALEPEVSS
jgi:AcrR family transcriptional regulator